MYEAWISTAPPDWFAEWKCQRLLEPLDFLSGYAFTAHEAGIGTESSFWAKVASATPNRTEKLRLHAVGPVQVNGTHFSVNRLRLNWKIHVFPLFVVGNLINLIEDEVLAEGFLPHHY